MIPVAPARFSAGISSRSCLSSRITSTATHAESASRLTVGLFSAGRKPMTSCSLRLGHVHLQADLRLGLDRAAQEHRDVFHLLALPGNRPRLACWPSNRVVLVSSVSTMRRLLARSDEPVSVRFDDAVEQAGLDFGGAPGEFDGDVDALRREIFAVSCSPVRWR